MIDYRELLTKYMAHVRDEEGITFVDHYDDVWSGGHTIPMSPEEVAELARIEATLPPRS